MNVAKGMRVGVLGAGQLALMLAEAGKHIGVDVICAGQPGDCAASVATVVPVNLEDASDVAKFAKQVDVVTVESENIQPEVLTGINLFPNAHAIGVAQDRLLEKRFFQECGLEAAPFAPVDTPADFVLALAVTGLPAILKTRRMGYDGKGQVRIYERKGFAPAWDQLGKVPCIVEGMLHFDTEVSLIAVRGKDGAVAFYPLVENFHRDGILRKSVAPFLNSSLQQQAEGYLRTLLEGLDYVGVLTVEFFVAGNCLIANEMAPRVHNSGHWTIEGSDSSQFENHLRAICGMPLGNTQSRPMIMLNCIREMPPEQDTKLFPELLRHDYGKEPRAARKVGHLTFAATEARLVAEWQQRLERSS